jgi:hypothetical protein
MRAGRSGDTWWNDASRTEIGARLVLTRKALDYSAPTASRSIGFTMGRRPTCTRTSTTRFGSSQTMRSGRERRRTEVRKSPAEAGLSRSLAFQTGLPAYIVRARHDQKAQRRAQASAASPPTAYGYSSAPITRTGSTSPTFHIFAPSGRFAGGTPLFAHVPRSAGILIKTSEPRRRRSSVSAGNLYEALSKMRQAIVSSLRGRDERIRCLRTPRRTHAGVITAEHSKPDRCLASAPP